jgi:hypothetical protein
VKKRREGEVSEAKKDKRRPKKKSIFSHSLPRLFFLGKKTKKALPGRDIFFLFFKITQRFPLSSLSLSSFNFVITSLSVSLSLSRDSRSKQTNRDRDDARGEDTFTTDQKRKQTRTMG